MATELSIKNRALTHCGELRLSGLTEDSVNKRLLNDIYHDSRRALLEMHSWKFARKQIELAQLTTTPQGYDLAFKLPSDLIKIIEFNNTDPEFREKLPFNTIDGELHTNETQAKIEYIYDAKNETLFSSGFVEALSLYLGMTIAFSRTKDQVLMDRLEARFEKALSRAKRSDAGQDNRPRAADIGFPNISARRFFRESPRQVIINN
jgi:hypothetical protein